MATQAQMEAVVDIVLDEMDSDPELWRSVLRRLKYTSRLNKKDSEISNKQAENTQEANEGATELAALYAERAAIQAQIDALES